MMLGELGRAPRWDRLTIVVVNNAAQLCQHCSAMLRGRYQSSDLVEMDYAAIAGRWGAAASAS
jgi:hypothetical protein